MSIVVNGETILLPEARATLAGLLSRIAPKSPFAVARNWEFVPSSAYEEHELEDGDRIEIVHPSAGG